MFTLAKVKLFTDSSADLSDDIYQQFDISVVPFYTTFDKKTYFKERKDISTLDFYKKLRTENVFPATSLPSAADYDDAFRPCVEEGMDIVCLNLSSKFSGSHQNARNAAEELKNDFPDRIIRVIDTMQAASAQGIILIQAARMLNDGLSADEIADRIDEIKHTARVFFTLDSLEYLRKGGRIGKASAFAGALLNIKPILVCKDGELHPAAKVRGRQKALDKVLSLAEEYVGSEKDEYDFLLSHADCYGEAEAFFEKVKGKGLKFDWPIMELGTTIGSHTGPTVIDIGMVKRYKPKE